MDYLLFLGDLFNLPIFLLLISSLTVVIGGVRYLILIYGVLHANLLTNYLTEKVYLATE